MPRADDFDNWVLEQLQGLPGISARAMFGGRGLYAGDLFFGILYDGCLYFHTDDRTRPGYIAAGSEPFQPNPKQRLKNYYEVPAEVLENTEQLTAWATAAILTRKGDTQRSA
jgi:DNA transformation protein